MRSIRSCAGWNKLTTSSPPAAVRPAATTRANNFGALRLVLAYLVLLSHSPELVDGNRSRELLTRVFGTVSFGELAVNCFFIISGYLITSSFLSSASGFEYLTKRVLRIYPGYIVAFVLCVFVLAPWVGGTTDRAYHGLFSRDSLVANIALLNLPEAPGAFARLHFPLNGSAWTIRYEFMAYLLVLALGLLGLLKNRRLILAATIILLGATMLLPYAVSLGVPAAWTSCVWSFTTEMRFLLMFASGALFYLFRERIVYRVSYAVIATIGLCALLLSNRTAQASIATFGAYLVFYLAFEARSRWLAGIGQRNDLSYGIYLYAWPVQASLVWFYPAISPWWMFAAACVGASLLGWISWLAVEKPAIRLSFFLRSRGHRRSPPGRA